jgi:hypothetical protein
MQAQKVLSRMDKLEKEMSEIRRSLHTQIEISLTNSKSKMHKAALDFIKLEDIPDTFEIGSVELVRQERKHARGY